MYAAPELTEAAFRTSAAIKSALSLTELPQKLSHPKAPEDEPSHDGEEKGAYIERNLGLTGEAPANRLVAPGTYLDITT